MYSGNVLLLYVNPESDLYNKYKENAEIHNQIKKYPDAGFDLFMPHDIECIPNHATKIDFEVIGAMYHMNDSGDILFNKPQSYYMYPRSSISKSNFRLSNNVGIIDSGYRGNIGAYFDTYPWNSTNYKIEKYTRYVQLCNSKLEYFKVIIVDNMNELGEYTERGRGGFGSTGK